MPSMFETAPGALVQGRPLLKLAACGVMAVVVIVVAAMGSASRQEPAAAVAQRGSAPLELVSMRYTREGRSLRVAGLVRNPRAGAGVARLTAVVFAFDTGGSFLASGRAPVDFLRLEPGDESPFVVTVPDVVNVARYRVSFRTEAGVVRHVDRRDDPLRTSALAAR